MGSVAMMDVVGMRVVGWTNVFHAVDAAALDAAFDGAIARHLEYVRRANGEGR